MRKAPYMISNRAMPPPMLVARTRRLAAKPSAVKLMQPSAVQTPFLTRQDLQSDCSSAKSFGMLSQTLKAATEVLGLTQTPFLQVKPDPGSHAFWVNAPAFLEQQDSPTSSQASQD